MNDGRNAHLLIPPRTREWLGGGGVACNLQSCSQEAERVLSLNATDCQVAAVPQDHGPRLPHNTPAPVLPALGRQLAHTHGIMPSNQPELTALAIHFEVIETIGAQTCSAQGPHQGFTSVSCKRAQGSTCRLQHRHSWGPGSWGARCRLTVLAGGAVVAGLAAAGIVVDAVGAGAVVLTGVGGALVDVGVAVGAAVAGLAAAGVAVDAVGAGAVVLAGVGGTLIDVDLAVGAGVAGLAEAGPAVAGALQALARIGSCGCEGASPQACGKTREAGHPPEQGTDCPQGVLVASTSGANGYAGHGSTCIRHRSR